MPKSQKIIPTMDEIISYLETQNRPMNKRELSRVFGLKGDDRISLKKMIRELKTKGLVHSESRGKKIVLPDSLPERLVVEVTGVDSMGDMIARPFEWPSDSPMPQIIIIKDKLSPAVGIGDVVQVSLKPAGARIYHAQTLRRVMVGDNQMVGVYENGKIYSVDRRLTQAFSLTGIPKNIILENRDLILAEIPPVRVSAPQAFFVRKIGTADEAYAATLISIYLHHLPVAFTELSEKQAARLTVPKIGKERVDLRSIPFVTIDGPDARDFDDAVWAERDTNPKNTGGFHVMIGIADVCFYVRPGTALDTDARLRGNSVYFPDRVIPMLPETISNGVCSLKPNEDRAALVCEVWIDKNGVKIKHRFLRALIRSARRLTYDEVQSALDHKTPIQGLENEICDLASAYQVLKKNRDKRGVLEIDVPERQVILNARGQVAGIHFRHQTESNRLIEELMILANVAAAETLEEKGIPVMYRVHDRPSFEKALHLSNYLMGLGQRIQLSDNPTARDFNAILKKAKGKPLQKTINELVLRSQSQACYSPENIGHFGLALARYAHFTSPIRRYADILVHRALIKALKFGEGALTDEEVDYFEDIAHHISATERQAASAEMDAQDRYVALYFSDRVGQKFNARISSITAFGIFVSVDSMGAEGFVPLSSISGDYYEYDERTQQLIGRATGKIFSLGQKVRCVLKESVPVTGGLKFQIISS
ncbi:MAG: ribonuclease R [Pseudomonadota bacterium]|nr:ribonuclease R [Pseudomonadota bacterium]